MLVLLRQPSQADYLLCDMRLDGLADELREPAHVIRSEQLEHALQKCTEEDVVYVLMVRCEFPLPLRKLVAEIEMGMISVLNLEAMNSRGVIVSVSCSKLDSVFLKLRKSLFTIQSDRLLAGISQSFIDFNLDSWQLAVQQAEFALQANMFSGDTLSIFEPHMRMPRPVVTSTTWFLRLSDLLHRDDIVNVIHMIKEHGEQIRKTRPLISQVADWCAQVMLFVVAIREESTSANSHIKLTETDWLRYFVVRCPKWNDWVNDLCEEVEMIICNTPSNSFIHHLHRSSQINYVLKLVQTNYKETLNRQDLAQKVFLSPSYLSKLFKSEVGMTLSDYITRFRMEKAKQILKEKINLKVCEVGREVGYLDPTQFVKSFKKCIGMTPNTYRKDVH